MDPAVLSLKYLYTSNRQYVRTTEDNGLRSHRCVNPKSQTNVFRVDLPEELCNPQQVELNPTSKQEKTAYRIGRLFLQ